jgi:hypothetical protein
METGSSYFEGATVEREFEKKFKGQTNIYDRLKCRPVLRTKRENNERFFNNSLRIRMNFWLIIIFAEFNFYTFI